MDNKEVNTILAIERTELANERNFLAYFRTFVVFLSSGLAIIKLNELNKLRILAFFLIASSIVILIFGGYRYLKVKNRINKFKKQHN